ncbi:MAG: hexapeptide transferase, partial [Saprospirales bacterium]
MLVVGAKGHAKEILQILEKDYSYENVGFFDNLCEESGMFFDRYLVLRTEYEVREWFANDNRFVLAVG